MPKTNTSLRPQALRLSRAHFAYVLILAAQIILYDASKLISPDFVLKRWVVTAGLLVVTTLVWAMAHQTNKTNAWYEKLIYGLILADILVASFSVYTQRGMASRAVLLYIIPIIVAASLGKRVALFGAALLSIAAYTTTAVMYFVLNFNEGYKVELYGEVAFYSAIFLLLASLLSGVIRHPKP
jgi:hypothetical protein